MASIKFPRKEFEKQVKISKEIEEKISLMGTHLESLTDEEIELEILPSRPDLFSMHGFLRAFKAFLGKEIGLKKYPLRKSDYKIIVDDSVKKVRPYSMAAVVKGIKFSDEKIKDIMQWQEKIHATIGRNRKKLAIGYYDLNKIKFPIKYTAKNPKEIVFVPLDMSEKMDGVKILARHPCGKEYGEQLDGFDKFPVYYDSNNEVLSMPPIINSNDSGKISADTSDILIECSGSDLNTLKKVITIAVVDLIEQGGKAYSVDVCYGSKRESISTNPEKMKISLENVNKWLGLQLKEKEMEKLLLKMCYGYENKKVLVPAWRTDILHEVDLIEDIAIAYGYDKMIPKMPNIATSGSESQENKTISKITEVLIGLGLVETSTLHLIKLKEAELMKIPLSEQLELLDSKTDYKVLRPNLLIPNLRVLSENKDNEYPQKIFEIGTTFAHDKTGKTETGIKEEQSLIIALTPSNFTEAKQVLGYLFRMLNISYSIEEGKTGHTIDGRTGKVLIGNKQIGHIGEIHPEVLRDWNLKMPVSVVEICLDDLL